MFKDIVQSQQELRAIFGQPSERAVLKCQSSLDEHSRAFIAASPFLHGDLVIQNCDNDGPAGLKGGNPRDTAPEALVALDKLTGKARWTTPRNQGRGFSTPRSAAW